MHPPLLHHHVHMHHVHLESVCQCPKAERGSPGKPPPQMGRPRLHECPCRHECAPPKLDKISFQTPPIATNPVPQTPTRVATQPPSGRDQYAIDRLTTCSNCAKCGSRRGSDPHQDWPSISHLAVDQVYHREMEQPVETDDWNRSPDYISRRASDSHWNGPVDPGWNLPGAQDGWETPVPGFGGLGNSTPGNVDPAVGDNGFGNAMPQNEAANPSPRDSMWPNPMPEDDGWNAPTPEIWHVGSTGAADDDWHAPPPRYPEPHPVSQQTWGGDTFVDAEPRKNQSPSDNLSKGASPLQNCCSRSASHYNCSSCSSYLYGSTPSSLAAFGGGHRTRASMGRFHGHNRGDRAPAREAQDAMSGRLNGRWQQDRVRDWLRQQWESFH
jgi:hypothetical protein